MKKKILVCVLALGAMMAFSGCAGKAETGDVSASKAEPEVVVKEENLQTASKKNTALYDAAYEEVKSYFGIAPDRALFTDKCVVDMGEYAIVEYTEGEGSIFASVTYEDKIVFSINALNYELYEFAKENQDKIKDIEDMTQIDEYMSSLEPGVESEAKEAVEKFILETDISELDLEFKEMFYEYVFDKQDKEYFVFEYIYENEDGTENPVFIRYHNLMKRVVSVIK